MGCWAWREWDEGKGPARGRPGRRSGGGNKWVCRLGVSAAIVCILLFYLRYIMLHCSPSDAGSRGEREQGLYGEQQADDEAVLGNYTRSR